MLRADPIITEDVIKTATTGSGAVPLWSHATYMNGGAGQNLTNGVDVKFDQSDGNIPYVAATGTWSLVAGNVYRCEGHFALNNWTGDGTPLAIVWVTAGGAPLVPDSRGFIPAPSDVTTATGNYCAAIIVAPLANVDVKMTVISGAVAADAIISYCFGSVWAI